MADRAAYNFSFIARQHPQASVLECGWYCGFTEVVTPEICSRQCTLSGESVTYCLTKAMSSFCKNEDCPPSERLLAFQAEEADPLEEPAIIAHLRSCDFCVAELEFYRFFPPVAETAVADPIPPPLFELASSLLGNGRYAAFGKFSKVIDQLYDDGF